MGEGFMHSVTITRYGFRIRTRSGLIVENLLIHGKDEADAERKLLQMYQHCKILERSVHKPSAKQADKPGVRRTELAATK
jgi:hypothetical protein